MGDLEVVSHVAAFDRVMAALRVGGKAVSKIEKGVVRKFWVDSLDWIDWENTGPLTLMLAEEALVLRVLTYRLLKGVRSGDDLMVERDRGPDVLDPAVEAWARTQERLRKVMKELLEHCKERDGGESVTLASMMVSVLEQGEGVLDDAVEFEARTKSVEEAGDGSEVD